ncbi:hypothetical protein CAPTEDRAFT_200496, partial [Capitella teleta]
MSALTIRSEFADALDRYPDSTVFYTDGSKSEDSVACSFFSSRLKLKMKLPVQMSVFTSEIIAILSALRCVEADNEQHQFVICSDSLSAIMAIHGMDVRHPYVLQVLYAIKSISQQEKIVVFMWCPSHVGIPGNEMADTLAKEALSSTNLAELPVPASDLRCLIKKYIRSRWQHEWDEQHSNKLHSIHPTIGPWPPCQREKRREEIVLARIRIGHTHYTHDYIPRGDDQTECVACVCPLTVQHIIIECADFLHIRYRDKGPFRALTTQFKAAIATFVFISVSEFGKKQRLPLRFFRSTSGSDQSSAISMSQDMQIPSTSYSHTDETDKASAQADLAEGLVPQASPLKTPRKVPVYEIATYSFLATPRRTTKDHPYSRKKMLPKEVLPESSSEVSAAPSSDSSPAAVELPTSTDSSLSAEDVELYSPSTPEPSSQESAEEADVQADEDPKILVFESSLQKLLNFCPDCGSPVV